MTEAGNNVKGLQSTVLLAGDAMAPVLKLTENISFWGGVDPLSGKIIRRQHPQFGKSIAGKILAMHCSIGSSSGSSVLLELFRIEKAPAGIVLTEADLVVCLGVVVAREMGFRNIPVVRINRSDFDDLNGVITINKSGEIAF